MSEKTQQQIKVTQAVDDRNGLSVTLHSENEYVIETESGGDFCVTAEEIESAYFCMMKLKELEQ